MTYLVDMPQQLRTFAYAVGFGFFIGVLYDVFRLVRLLICGGKNKAFFVSDLLFALAAAFLTFLFALTLLNGGIRGYVLFGELLGFLIYYISFGTFVVRVTDKIAATLRRALQALFHAIAKPFLALHAACRRIYAKIVQKAQKRARFSAKKSKIHLKNIRDLLYNHQEQVFSGDELSPDGERDGKCKKKNPKKEKAKT